MEFATLYPQGAGSSVRPNPPGANAGSSLTGSAGYNVSGSGSGSATGGAPLFIVFGVVAAFLLLHAKG